MNDRPTLPLNALLHGADYYPEQWDPTTWRGDVELMQEARLNTVTLGVFAWAELEPEEGRYEFGWMDDVIELLHSQGKRIILATPSAAPPAWLTKRYPEVLRTGASGVRNRHGNRVNFCWSSPAYREKVRGVNERLARRYGHHPAILLWHVGNEYGGACHCELCAERFRAFLQAKFDDDLDALNRAYWTRFWSHRFTDWAEIEIPGPPYGETTIQGLTLDFRRFTTQAIVEFFESECEPLRRHSPDVPITTNLMGFYDGLDPWQISKHVDVVSWDSYPYFRTEPMDVRGWALTAMTHDLARSLAGEKQWLLMESSPSSSNWYPVMGLKPPGAHLFECLQAVAHGSESVMYFQWRQSRGGQEKLHGAVVSTGQGNQSKVFADVAHTGAVLDSLRDLVGSRCEAEAAVIFDWENRWALDGSCGPIQGDKGYLETVLDHYLPLWEAGITVDVISQEVDFSKYRLVLAPMLYLLKPGTVERLTAFVEGGGTLLTTYLTAWVDENDLTFAKGVFSPLSELFGVRVEELDALYPGHAPCVVLPRGTHFGVEGAFDAVTFAERIHAFDAEVVGSYGRFWYSEQPAITRRFFGKGEAIYVGARLGMEFNEPFLNSLTSSLRIQRNYHAGTPAGVTVQKRSKDAIDYVLLLNAGRETAHVPAPDVPHVDMFAGRPVSGQITLPPLGVAVLRAAPTIRQAGVGGSGKTW